MNFKFKLILVKPSNTKFFCSSTVLNRKVTPVNIKNKNLSSQLWLKRQLSDPYVEKAKISNYRCRSAFKLLEINKKFNFFSPGQTVIDCGAAPGSWTQVAVKEVNSDGKLTSRKIGKVISIDKQCLHHIEGATILGNMDFTDPDSQARLRVELGELKPHVVISDMAPSATGIKEMDVENILTLCYSVLRFAVQISESGATLLVKIWQCGQAKQFESDVLRFYENTRFVKPHSSRNDSAEIFLLGRHFKGLKPD